MTQGGLTGRRGRIGGRVLRIAVTVVLLGGLVWILPAAELIEAFRAVSFALWALILGGFLAGHGLGVLKWRILVGSSGLSVPLPAAFRAYGMGLFANLCLPSLVGGDLVRAGVLARGHGGGEALAVGGVADRMMDATALAVLASTGLVLTPAVPASLPQRVLAFSAVVILVASALPLGLRAVRRSGRPLPQFVARLLTATDALLARPAAAALAFALSLVIQTSFVVLNATMGTAMGIDVGLTTWLLVWPSAKLVATVPISLGGIGVREAALAAFLSPFAVPSAHAVAQSLVWETVLIAGALLAGLATLPVSRWRAMEST